MASTASEGKDNKHTTRSQNCRSCRAPRCAGPPAQHSCCAMPSTCNMLWVNCSDQHGDQHTHSGLALASQPSSSHLTILRLLACSAECRLHVRSRSQHGYMRNIPLLQSVTSTACMPCPHLCPAPALLHGYHCLAVSCVACNNSTGWFRLVLYSTTSNQMAVLHYEGSTTACAREPLPVPPQIQHKCAA